jgi:hypothetical protein
MNQPPGRQVELYTVDDVVHIRVDAPGERAVSAPVTDVLELIGRLAKEAGFEVEDSVPGELYVSWPV